MGRGQGARSRSRTGGKAPISGFIRLKRATRKSSQPAAARRVALKMGRRPCCPSVTSRTIFGPAGENQIGGKMVRDAPSTASSDRLEKQPTDLRRRHYNVRDATLARSELVDS